MYDKALENAGIDVLKHYTEDYASSGHLYLTRISGQDESFRNRVIEKMAEVGIATNVHYKPLPLHTAYNKLGFEMKDYPNAFDMYRNEITLPLHTLLTNEEVDYVASGEKEILRVLREEENVRLEAAATA